MDEAGGVGLEVAVCVAAAVCVTVALGLAVAVDDAVRVAVAVRVADGLAVTDALLADVAEAGGETAGEVFTVLLGRGDDEAGVLAWGVETDGTLEPDPVGVQAATATATSSTPANVVRRTFTKPPRLPGG